jgi:DHA1 family bicyclomycin/chloramphenicol resistance-like MFS transporter
VVAGGMVAATLALLLIARPHKMTDPDAEPTTTPLVAEAVPVAAAVDGVDVPDAMPATARETAATVV